MVSMNTVRHSLAVLACTLLACSPAASPDGTQTTGDATATATATETTPEATAPGSATGKPSKEFALGSSTSAKDARGVNESTIKPTRTEAALKMIVNNKDDQPIPGIVVTLTDPDGKKVYAEETDAMGYTELLVPVGKKYEILYLSLGRKDFAANVTVTDEPSQNIKLTLRFKKWEPEPKPLVLDGVEFDTGKATIRPDSLPKLDVVLEFMTHKKSARVEISGHTDNKGGKAANKKLSQQRAEACRDYLVSKGIDKSRIEAVGYGDEKPLGQNETEPGRQRNRRIEANELPAK